MSLSHDLYDDETISAAESLLEETYLLRTRGESCPECLAKAVLVAHDNGRCCETCLSCCVVCGGKGAVVVDANRVQFGTSVVTVDGCITLCSHHYQTEIYEGEADDQVCGAPGR